MKRLSAFPTSDAKANDLVAAAYIISESSQLGRNAHTDKRPKPSVVNCTNMVWQISVIVSAESIAHRRNDGKEIGSKIVFPKTGDEVYQQDIAKRREYTR